MARPRKKAADPEPKTATEIKGLRHNPRRRRPSGLAAQDGGDALSRRVNSERALACLPSARGSSSDHDTAAELSHTCPSRPPRRHRMAASAASGRRRARCPPIGVALGSDVVALYALFGSHVRTWCPATTGVRRAPGRGLPHDDGGGTRSDLRRDRGVGQLRRCRDLDGRRRLRAHARRCRRPRSRAAPDAPCCSRSYSLPRPQPLR